MNLPIDVVPLQVLPPKFRLKVLSKGLVTVEELGLYEAILIQTMDELTILNLEDRLKERKKRE